MRVEYGRKYKADNDLFLLLAYLHRRLPLLYGEECLHLHADLHDLHGVGGDHLLYSWRSFHKGV